MPGNTFYFITIIGDYYKPFTGVTYSHKIKLAYKPEYCIYAYYAMVTVACYDPTVNYNSKMSITMIHNIKLWL